MSELFSRPLPNLVAVVSVQVLILLSITAARAFSPRDLLHPGGAP